MRAASRILIPLCLVLALFAACSGGDISGPTQGNFPANASRPQPHEETFHGCPAGGDGGDQVLNSFKNRIDDGDNGQYMDVSLDALLGLTWPSSIERVHMDQWSSSDSRQVTQFEGVPVRTSGYIIGVKHEGTESTNCHAVDYRDFHMWLAASPSASKDQSMVIEVTPRVRDVRPGWSTSTLEGLVGQQVLIEGWTMLDEEHPEQIGQTRETLWEIHPIMHIEVNQGGSWTSIDQ
jgi:hypothetical protein